MYSDPTKVSVNASSYVSKKGETVKTWQLHGLTSWKSITVMQGEEVQVLACLEKLTSEFKRMAGLRVKLEEAQVNLNRAKASREAFTVLFQKYPDKLVEEMETENAAVIKAELALKAITG